MGESGRDVEEGRLSRKIGLLSTYEILKIESMLGINGRPRISFVDLMNGKKLDSVFYEHYSLSELRAFNDALEGYLEEVRDIFD